MTHASHLATDGSTSDQSNQSSAQIEEEGSQSYQAYGPASLHV